MTFTPSKSPSKIVIRQENQPNIEIPLDKGAVTIEHCGLYELPDIEFDTPQKGQKGIWTDAVKLYFLYLWIMYNPKPFYENRNPAEGKKVLEAMRTKCKIWINDECKALGTLSPVVQTFWDKLTKGREGLSFDKETPLMKHLDNKMVEKYGDNVSAWTHRMALNILSELMSELRAQSPEIDDDDDE